MKKSAIAKHRSDNNYISKFSEASFNRKFSKMSELGIDIECTLRESLNQSELGI